MPRTTPANQATPSQTNFVTDIEAAAYLGLAVSTLRNHRRSGTGPRYAKLGSSVRYTFLWLDEFALQSVVDPKSAA
jgi:predicted DNA-binding transcriptional regulator AlpA